ncbi:predicted protein [Histoplasma capsulatum var. duboisii H88]|uniref:Predicted protein n=2 Tax=Ajellomyces capsulatus TaxID=5037 RepID=F0U5A8_AJEC8|nr:predicted protein [Histoplasma capsulatum H143]EGC42099.1 predicted protein [Histoplasma capsulatum var. duboisii H88]
MSFPGSSRAGQLRTHASQGSLTWLLEGCSCTFSLYKPWVSAKRKIGAVKSTGRTPKEWGGWVATRMRSIVAR